MKKLFQQLDFHRWILHNYNPEKSAARLLFTRHLFKIGISKIQKVD